MPMRWTSENDQMLLIKFLETHDVSVDPKKISEAWPTANAEDRPTPRAITERLHKIRALAKAAAGGVSKSATPKTPTSRKRNVAMEGSKSTSKRSRTGTKNKNVKEEMEFPGTPTPANNGGPVKQENFDDGLVSNGQLEDVFTQEPWGKRVRSTPSLPYGMMAYNANTDDEDNVKYESSTSEFAPEHGDGDEKDDDDYMDGAVKEEFF